MCEVVEISDDEDSFVLENDPIVVPKDEDLNYDLPMPTLSYDLPPPNMCSRPGLDDVASSSGTNLRSSFIGMGFAPSLVDKAIEEHGEGNPESLLETLFTYSDLQKLKTEVFDDGSFSGGDDNLAANHHAKKVFRKPESLNSMFGEETNKNGHYMGNIPLKEEHDIGCEVGDEKMTSLLKMNFSLDEVGFAMHRLGKHASIGQLMDFIFAARMAKKYEKDPNNPFPANEETEKDYNNEALFGIMEKTLQLLEMGFTENEISAAFAKYGSEASVTELADFIVAAGTGPNADKYFYTLLSEASIQTNSQPLKRKLGDCDSLLIKTEEFSSDVVSQIGTSDLLEKLKGKMPKEAHTDEPNNWRIPKEEFMEESSSCVGRMLLEARTGLANPVAAPLRRARRVASLEEDRKPMSIPNPCRSLSSVVAKPPYFLYGNVTYLSHNSWVKISQFLYSIQPEFVDSQSYSALNRREGYVHNLPIEDRFHIFPRGPMSIQEVMPLAKKWWPSWDERKQLKCINFETTGVSHLCDGLGRLVAESKGLPSAEVQREVIQHCEAKNLVWVGSHRLAPLEPEHLERIMGYPMHHSRAAGLSSMERLKALRLSFQTDTLGYHLSVLKPWFPEGVTVLSFFDGIGGVEVALHRLGIRMRGVVAVEPSETKRRMVKKWWENSGQSGELIQLESIHKLSSSKLEDVFHKFKGIDLVVCQNPYSGGDSDSLAGLDFSMFVEFVRVVQRVRSMDKNR